MKTVICHSCGASVDENALKCPYCDTIVNENGIDIDEVSRKENELREKCIQLLKEGKIIRARMMVKDEAKIININNHGEMVTYISSGVTAYLSKIKREEGIPDVASGGYWCYIYLIPALFCGGIGFPLFISLAIDYHEPLYLLGIIPVILLWYLGSKHYKQWTQIK